MELQETSVDHSLMVLKGQWLPHIHLNVLDLDRKQLF